jgi:DNA-binding transcriptional LysR family regulator
MRQMNINQFETLIWVARLGSFRAASRHLKMTQPAVSARIRELERELGVNLFDRTLRAVKLTPKGRELMEYAEQIVSLAALVQKQVGHDQAIAGRVRLGVTSIPARTWLPRLMRTINRSYPGVVLEILVESSEHLGDELVKGDLDAAFLAGPFRKPHMHADIIGEVSMSLLASPELEIPQTPLTPKELEAWPIISAPRGSHLHNLVSEWFHTGGAQMQLNHACSSLTTRIMLAAAGVGLAVASPASAARELAEGRLRIVNTATPLPSLEYVVAFRKLPAAPAVQLVVALAKQFIGEKSDIHFYYSDSRH